jgi:hypothetical protein
MKNNMKINFIKKITGLLLVTLTFTFVACDNDNDNPTPVESEFEILQGDITSDVTLDASKRYLLRGKVYVQDGATIKIPAGTVIFGEKSTDGTLVINRGGKIDAQGTAANPIVFTSQAPAGFRNRGDWGGIVILGGAYTNNEANALIEGITSSAQSQNGLYGPDGTRAADDNDNSGIMKFVRIEFAGIDLSLDNELNSLTMGSVGSATQIDHIMVSYANDDAYEWFGGSNNHKYLIAYSTLDDDFDTDRGWNGKVQYGYVVRDPLQADVSGSRAFESSSNSKPLNELPAHGVIARHSKPIFSNITVLGPRLFRSTVDGFYQAAVEINSSSNVQIYNSIITGFPTGARWNVSGAESLLKNNIFAHNATLTAVSGGSVVPASFETDNIIASDVTTIFGDFASNGVYDYANPPFFQASNSPYISGAPNVDSIDAFFENQPFYGAAGISAHNGWNWTSGWINWDPINTNYALTD